MDSPQTTEWTKFHHSIDVKEAYCKTMAIAFLVHLKLLQFASDP